MRLCCRGIIEWVLNSMSAAVWDSAPRQRATGLARQGCCARSWARTRSGVARTPSFSGSVIAEGGAYAIDDELQPVLEGALTVG